MHDQGDHERHDDRPRPLGGHGHLALADDGVCGGQDLRDVGPGAQAAGIRVLLGELELRLTAGQEGPEGDRLARLRSARRSTRSRTPALGGHDLGGRPSACFALILLRQLRQRRRPRRGRSWSSWRGRRRPPGSRPTCPAWAPSRRRCVSERVRMPRTVATRRMNSPNQTVHQSSSVIRGLRFLSFTMISLARHLHRLVCSAEPNGCAVRSCTASHCPP